MASDLPVLQRRRQRPLRGRRRAAAQGSRRSAGAAHRHPLRARLAPVLQAIRRAVRRLRGETDLPRVRRRRAHASRPVDPRVPRAARAAEPRAQPVIDLHTHTTASDGRCSPAELVARAAAAGIRVLAVTDHDTVAGCEAAEAASSAAGIEFVNGIEITAIRDGGDVHVLGYFIDRHSPSLLAFLATQRQRRIDRVRQMIERLASFDIQLDADLILQPGIDDPAKSVGRPWIARALVASGHVADTSEAFEKWLARGRPAFVPRAGVPPEHVFGRIHEAGGIASLAHPGLVRHDEWIAGFAAAGLDAIEAYHSDHDSEATARYVNLAEALGLALSGGSDYHADDSHGGIMLGTVSLPRGHFDRLISSQPAGRRLRAK
ncbi:MAG: hypothetical protein DMG03_28100 [Acidobacteria bacterium]|nr:MAG: hypothetical protein DMG03_28100 [Acidobacteriota bacterium]